MPHMPKTVCIQCRVSEETKAALIAAASSQGLTLSALLHRMTSGVTLARGVHLLESGEPAAKPVRRAVRMAVRLRGEDALLLKERASARGLAPATYVSLLVRSHLRNLAPLPDRELDALMKLVGAVNAMGRNVNQIARSLTQGGPVAGIDSQSVLQMMRVLEIAMHAAKALVTVNIKSWESGHGKAAR
jgi:predicted DNA binding CopG/RHH family protein